MTISAMPASPRADASALLAFDGPAHVIVVWSVVSGPGTVTPLADVTDATGRAWAATPSPFQSPKCFSSNGTTSSRVVSPTTIRVAFSGRTHCRWKSTSSSRPSAPIEASVPVPLNGIA